VEIVEVDPVECLIEGADRADFVDGPFGAATRESEAYLGGAAGRVDHRLLPDVF